MSANDAAIAAITAFAGCLRGYRRYHDAEAEFARTFERLRDVASDRNLGALAHHTGPDLADLFNEFTDALTESANQMEELTSVAARFARYCVGDFTEPDMDV